MPRPDLTMRPAARAAFLGEERIVRLATIDTDGWPVIVPLWFVAHADDRGELWVWNLNRARRTGRLEAGTRCGVTIDGGVQYHELHGLTARALPRRIDDADVPLEVRLAYARKYAGSDEPQPHASHHTWFALALSGERSWDFRRLAEPQEP